MYPIDGIITGMEDDKQKLIQTLMTGGIAVIRTDTVYGIVARANDEIAVERVYDVKGRDADKSCIVLIADPMQAYGQYPLGYAFTSEPTSVLVESPKAPSWLLRANSRIAHRIPAVDWLKEVIREVGPLIAPSANPQGKSPALSVEQATMYFGDSVDLYIDGGNVPANTAPSRLLWVHDNGEVERLR
jgi:L-threonylcarbamoyladenylate synthase